MTVTPFLTYKLLPSQAIIRENIRFDHVKEDIDTLIHTLTPILYITKSNVPKPPFLDPSVVEHLIDKPGTLSLLGHFGWRANNRGDYVFIDANSAEETHRREEIINEFRQFCNELKKIKENDINSVENSHSMITTIPFSSYQIIPAEKIIRNNIHLERIRENLDSMIHALTPILYLTKKGVPKPPFLDPSIIQQLNDQPGTLDLLPLVGCMTNDRGDYIFLDGTTPEAIASQETAANEFRRFYDELKKMKNGNADIVEYYLRHPTNGVF